MKKRSFIIIVLFMVGCIYVWTSEVGSLSQIFLLGKGIQDQDGDGLADKISLQIVIPSTPTARELAAASDIAARVNLESLAQDFDLVKKESELQSSRNLQNLILIGSNLELTKEILKENKRNIPSLGSHQGLVFISAHKGRNSVVLMSGSDESLLKTARAFFLRWPYLWDIWGRDEGATYFSVEKDLTKFLENQGIHPQGVVVRSALYEFLPVKSPHDAIKRLDFTPGEIKELTVEILASSPQDEEKAFRALETLQLEHQKGQNTEVLSYPGCAKLTFVLKQGGERSRLTLPRLGYPRRFLTPSYKDPRRGIVQEKDFDLLSLFTAKGFYSDNDKDNILDGLETSVIISKNLNTRSIARWVSRLVLPSAGAAFPILYLEDELENRKALTAPILIGQSGLSQELVKTGKLKIPTLAAGWGMAEVISKAFNKSNALTIVAADDLGLEKILDYLSLTFPYLDESQEGNPRIHDVVSDVEKFLKGENGSAEAHILRSLRKIVQDIKEKELSSFQAEFYLPRSNPKFEEFIQQYLQESLKKVPIEIKNFTLKENKKIFEKEKEFPWEGDEAVGLIAENVKNLQNAKSPLKIRLAVSESPQVRQRLKSKIEALLQENKISDFDVEVLSAYKQGFFWLTEQVLPALRGKKVHSLTIKFAEEKENWGELKRFYSEPVRWLQELYPADEILSAELNIPLERIDFQIKSESSPIYEALAFDERNSVLYQESFSPPAKEIFYLKTLPEWGKVRITPGWLEIQAESKPILNTILKCDLEKFWEFYQDEGLAPLYSYIMKKTANEPKTSKQPYFKRLLVEMWFSEPDYKLGLDEEIVSSLEAMHDEIYFDTLDFLRGITEIELEEKDQPEDTSRLSAPGNILPLIHPSTEGGKGKARIVFEDWQASFPQLILKWKEKGREEEFSKKAAFPSIKAKSLRVPTMIYNGPEDKIENLTLELDLDSEAEYMDLLDILESSRELQAKALLPPWEYPNLKSLTLKIKFKELEKEETLTLLAKEKEKKPFPARAEEASLIPDEIISPEKCLDIVQRLSQFKKIRSYIGGKSYEGRDVPVLEIFTPLEKYVSVARLITLKPTLFLTGRQHANEVSSTNYILKLAELLAKDPAYEDYVKKINFVFQPMENTDGAALAYDLQKLTPFHSLHAGRYSSLGVDIGYQVNISKPFLPEASVRKNLYEKWLPDIYLNLHGYPSHEWVQQFSNYSPYLFRNYWIPKGWFAFYQALSLPIYEKWKQAGEELKNFIIKEMQANPKIRDSNKKFYDRYWRWSGRWQPHLNYLEIYDGLNLYAKRRDSREAKLSTRTQTTFVEETPELMDETAHGSWLAFLNEQGITYLRAHLKYLSQARHEVSRIEEEVQDRVRIQLVRSRPGKID